MLPEPPKRYRFLLTVALALVAFVGSAQDYLYRARKTGDYSLQRSDLDGANSAPVYTPAGNGYVKLVSIDSLNQRLFFFDPVVGKIQFCNLDGTGVTDVRIESNLTDLAYYDGKVYYARKHTDFDLRRCDVDGSNDEQLYTPADSAIGYVKSITIAPATQKLFFYDPKEETIYRADLDGGNRVALKMVKNLFDMAVYEGSLYYGLQDTGFDLRKFAVADPTADSQVLALAGHAKRVAIDLQSRKLYVVDPAAAVSQIVSRADLDGGNRSDVSNENVYAVAPFIRAVEIAVTGNGFEIVSGDSTPSLVDGTDFGDVTTPVLQTFTIRNTGRDTLTLSAPITVTGAGFSLASAPAQTTLAADASTTFQVQLSPTAVGVHTGQVTIASNDPDEASYTFSLRATGVLAEMLVEGNSVEITSGDDSPSTADYTQFDDAFMSGYRTRTFVIRNAGTAALNLTGTPLVESDNPEFTVTADPSASIAPSGYTTFVVRFTPSALGTRTATLSIANSDVDENPYTFTVSGFGFGFDLGDAPDPTYPTVRNSDGARHRLPSALYLGANADIENDAQPNADATGDDTDGTDDDDGVTFPALQVGANADLTVNASAAGLVNAWIDFNQDGDWADTGEQVLTNAAVVAGDNTLTITVPVGASAGNTFARFRVSTAGGDGVTGEASNGEVEDYQIAIAMPEITVEGNSVQIANGDSTPAIADDTDFGDLDIAATAVTRSFTIRNTGSAVLTLTSVTVTANQGFSVTNPSSPIAAGGNTTFSVTFDPSTVGTKTATISIASNDPDDSPFTFVVEGEATAAPEISIEGNSVEIASGDTTPAAGDDTAFGSLNVNSPAVVHTFTIQNTGSAALDITGASITANQGFTVSTPTSPIAAGGNATFTVTFDPSTAGTKTATVSIANSDANESPYAFTVQGTATAPDITVTGNGQNITDDSTAVSDVNDTDFGSLDIAATAVVHTFTVTNDGDAPLNISSASITIGQGFSVSSPTTPIAVSASATFTVTFNPSAVGTKTATVTLANDDPDEAPFTFLVQGVATAAPEMSVEGNSVEIASGDTSPSTADDTDFGYLDIDAGAVTRTFTIRNTGSAELTLGTVGITATQGFSISTPASPVAATNGTSTFTVTFDPSATGTKIATVTIVNDDSDENPYTFTVRGIASAAPVAVVEGNGITIANGDTSPDTNDDTNFGSANVIGATVSHTLKLKNTGSAPLTISSITFTGSLGEYSVAAPASVAVGGEANLIVEFDPADVGARNATISIASNDPASPYTFALTGTGTNVPPIADASTADSPTIVGQAVTITGSGSNDPDGFRDPLTYSWRFVSGPGAEPVLTNLGDWMEASFVPGADGRYIYELTVSDGIDTDTDTVTIIVGDIIQVTLAANATEGDGTIAGSVTTSRPLLPAESVTVTLSSSDTTAAQVIASTVTLSAAQPSQNFTVQIVDDALDDGSQVATISATATDWVPASHTLTVLDNEEPTMSVTGTFDFGTVVNGGTATQDFTIANTGTVALTISGISFTGADASHFSVTSTVPTSVPAGGTALFTVTYDPADDALASSATMTIANNSSDTNTFAVSGAQDALGSGGSGSHKYKKIRTGCALQQSASHGIGAIAAMFALLLALSILRFRARRAQ